MKTSKTTAAAAERLPLTIIPGFKHSLEAMESACGLVLRKHGFCPCVQAGSASWPMDLSAPDPLPTHFSYKWDGTGISAELLLELGELPESHVWLGLVDAQEVVDFATGDLPRAARMTGIEWTGPRPPDFVCAKVNELPAGMLYAADKRA